MAVAKLLPAVSTSSSVCSRTDQVYQIDAAVLVAPPCRRTASPASIDAAWLEAVWTKTGWALTLSALAKRSFGGTPLARERIGNVDAWPASTCHPSACALIASRQTIALRAQRVSHMVLRGYPHPVIPLRGALVNSICKRFQAGRRIVRQHAGDRLPIRGTQAGRAFDDIIGRLRPVDSERNAGRTAMAHTHQLNLPFATGGGRKRKRVAPIRNSIAITVHQQAFAQTAVHPGDRPIGAHRHIHRAVRTREAGHPDQVERGIGAKN